MLATPISGFEKHFVERFWFRNSGNGTKSHFPNRNRETFCYCLLTTRYYLLLEQIVLRKGVVVLVGDDDVVNNTNAHQFTSTGQSLGDLQVIF